MPYEFIIGLFASFVLGDVLKAGFVTRKERTDIVQAFTHPEVIAEHLSGSVVAKLASRSISRIVRDDSLANSIMDLVQSRIAHNVHYRRSFHLALTFRNVKKPADIYDEFFYEVEYAAHYDSTLGRTREFVLYSDPETWDKDRVDEAVEYRHLQLPTWAFHITDPRCLRLVEFSVDKRRLGIRERKEKGGRRYIVSVPGELLDGKKHRISYRVVQRVLKRSHVFFVEVRVPTEEFHLSVNYADTDIFYMELVDLLASSFKGSVSRDESAKSLIFHGSPGWVLPKSGVALAWQRVSERRSDHEAAAVAHPAFAKLLHDNLKLD